MKGCKVKTIWKFPLEITDEQTVKMPATANIIAVQFQGEQLMLWAVVDPKVTFANVVVRIVGTGNPFPDANDCRFVGTVQQGPFVWHVFMAL